MTQKQSTDLHRMTYFSSATEEMSPAQLDSILEASRENNPRHGVTGLLLYHDLRFFQALEGPRAQVEEVYIRIATDRRHKRCLVLEFRPVETRIFERWSMGYKSGGDLNSSQKRSFLDLTKIRDNFAENAAIGGSETWVLLDSFLSSFRDLQLV